MSWEWIHVVPFSVLVTIFVTWIRYQDVNAWHTVFCVWWYCTRLRWPLQYYVFWLVVHFTSFPQVNKAVKRRELKWPASQIIEYWKGQSSTAQRKKKLWNIWCIKILVTMIITRMGKDTHLCYINLENPIGRYSWDSNHLHVPGSYVSIYTGFCLKI